MENIFSIERLRKSGHLGKTGAEEDRAVFLLEEIRRLKKEKDAFIIAHNYVDPALFNIADVLGDSMRLALEGGKTSKPVIVCCTVHFMAEGAKIYSPEKTILLPNLAAGCSLAASADPDDVEDRVEELRAYFPDLQVVSYVNTSAAVKALSDVCCTSSSAVEIVKKLSARHILFLPDQNLATYVAEQSGRAVVPIDPKSNLREQTEFIRFLSRVGEYSEIVFAWGGNCYVHEQITPSQIRDYRDGIPGIVIFVHPECRKDVQILADEVLSTEQMVTRAKARSDQKFLIVTECGLSERLEMEVPDKEFFRSCQLCRYMKAITLEDTLEALRNMKHVIEVPEAIRVPAKRALDRMFELSGNLKVTKRDIS